MNDVLARLRVLATGRCRWATDDDEHVEVDHLGWRDRWAIFGVHSHNWWWVRRFGSRPCGCTVNPVTRRRVLFCRGCAWGDWDELGDDD